MREQASAHAVSGGQVAPKGSERHLRGGRRRTRSPLWRYLRLALNYSWLVVVLLILWGAVSNASTAIFLPPLQDIGYRVLTDWLGGALTPELVPSLRNLAIGYLAACFIGIAFAMVLWRWKFFYRIFQPLIYFVYVIPKVALLPALIVFAGIGITMKVSLIVLAAIWPTLLNTLDGLRGIDSVKLKTAAAMGMSRTSTAFTVVLPNALPQIAAGMRNSLQISVIMLVASELIASNAGIGFAILRSQQRFDNTGVWAGVIVLSVIGALLSFVFVIVERKVLHWFTASRSNISQGK